MKRYFLLGCFLSSMLFFMGESAFAAVIDFTGGTAYLSDGSTAVTDNTAHYDFVDYYIQDDFKIDFINSPGIIGNYYSIGDSSIKNDVLHHHWSSGDSIVFSKADGSAFDLNYFTVSSNTIIGGGQSSGTEQSFITASNGASLLLPSSDWGFERDYFGEAGDGIAKLWLDESFKNITSFTVTSQNAYCLGMDDFYIDQTAPPVPIPAAIYLFGAGIAGLIGIRRKKTSRI